jgi:CBS domain containing-hemolysin-like protein
MFWAYFAGSETAFVSVSRFKLNNLKRKGKKSASLAHYLLTKPERLLTTSLIGTNFCLVMSANLTSLLFYDLIGRSSPIISVVVITLTSLILCEIIPKNFAVKKSLQVTLISALPMFFFYLLFYPAGILFAFFSKMVIRLVGITYTGFRPRIFSKKEDVKMFLTASLKGKITKDQSRYFLDSLDFGGKTLSAIMVSLVEMHALPITGRVKDCYLIVSRYGKSFIPVYEERIDNIVGVVYAADLFGIDKNTALSTFLHPPSFVPENKNINQLYRELHEKDLPIVFAVDEHGGVTGMGTVYDIGEEIIGKISSFEEKRSLIVKIKENEYLCEGEVEIEEVNQLLSIEIHTEEFNTINGLLLNALGRIPQKGDYADTAGFRFSVERSTSKRAELIRIAPISYR